MSSTRDWNRGKWAASKWDDLVKDVSDSEEEEEKPPFELEEVSSEDIVEEVVKAPAKTLPVHGGGNVSFSLS